DTKMKKMYKPHLRFLVREKAPPPPDQALAKAGKQMVPYWAPRLALFVVTDFSKYEDMTEQHVSPFMLYFFLNSDSYDSRSRTYIPVLHVDDLGTLQKDLLPLNASTVLMPLAVSIEPLGKSRFEWMLKMEQSVQMHRDLGTPESEMEEVRRMFVETSSWLLIVTIVVSFVHLLFDMLAFKNDIQFWSSLKSTKGISVQSISVSTGMEVVVFLYLFDSETSYLVLFTVAGTIVVNVWKLVLAWRMMYGGGVAVPTAQQRKAAAESAEAQKVSQQIDKIAASYLFYCLAPPILGYAVYSLIYEQHKGWYSWVLKSGVNCVYAVGFMMMTPQLFLNYKYKSVEHLPWRALVYRALNTFIDDLFAFVIHMPGMHRMSVFRDDIVFMVYIYQRWVYSKRRPAESVEGQAAAAASKDK
ncbi:cleft lip and palate transmembrane protein 1-domain-containing protein, partial [Baffinella frigidus]